MLTIDGLTCARATGGYCLLEQLWLEAYAGVITASRHSAEPAVRQEGVAMAATLNSMLQGKVQCRRMRHTVADWACELAPGTGVLS